MAPVERRNGTPLKAFALVAAVVLVVAWAVSPPRGARSTAESAPDPGFSTPAGRPEVNSDLGHDPATRSVSSEAFVDAADSKRLRVKVVDEAGAGIAGAAVYLSASHENCVRRDATTPVATDSGGGCEIDRPTRPSRLSASASGFAIGSAPVPDEDVEEIRIGLRRAATLRVEAKSLAGEPVAGFGVTLSASAVSATATLDDPRPTLPAGDRPTFRATTDGLGVATFDQVADGDYRLTLLGGDHVAVDPPNPASVKVVGATAVSVTLAPIVVVAVRLAQPDERVDALTFMGPTGGAAGERRWSDLARPALQLHAQRIRKATGAAAAHAALRLGTDASGVPTAPLVVRFVDDSRMTIDVPCVPPMEFRAPTPVDTSRHALVHPTGELLAAVELRNGRDVALPLRAFRPRELLTSSREFAAGTPIRLPAGSYQVSAAEGATGAWLFPTETVQIRSGERTTVAVRPTGDVRTLELSIRAADPTALPPTTVRLYGAGGDRRFGGGTRVVPILADLWKIEADGYEVVGSSDLDLRAGQPGDRHRHEVVFRERDK